MVLTTVLSLAVLGQDVLPGSRLSLEQAKEEARSIVVAEVGKTGDRLTAQAQSSLMSFLLWTELKPSAVLKGEVSREELNRLPLTVVAEGKERLPSTGDEFIFFVGNDRDDAPITKMMPKTAENLAAIEKALPYRRNDPVGGGLGGGSLGGGSPRFEPRRPRPDQGTKISADPNATGDLRKVQEEFGAALSRTDPDPEDRRDHFAWLDQNEFARRYGVRRIGWWGVVLRCTPRDDGGATVKVVFRPWLDSLRYVRFTYVHDTVEETYDFTGGTIRRIESDAGVAKPGLQHFPVAF